MVECNRAVVTAEAIGGSVQWPGLQETSSVTGKREKQETRDGRGPLEVSEVEGPGEGHLKVYRDVNERIELREDTRLLLADGGVSWFEGRWTVAEKQTRTLGARRPLASKGFRQMG